MIQDAITQNTDKVTRPDTTPGPNPQGAKPPVEIEKAENKTLAADAEKKREGEVSQAFLEELEQDIESIHNIGLKFSVHHSTGRTMVKVINKEDGSTIREIPSKRLLDLSAKLDEMIGMIFDRKV
jgi:flagellar protein FlaG